MNTLPAGSRARMRSRPANPQDGLVASDRDRDAQGRARNARPRDGLGRPLPYGAVGEERAPEGVLRPPDQALAEAQHLLDAGRPFHAHEVLEDAWKSAPEEERLLWRGGGPPPPRPPPPPPGDPPGGPPPPRRGGAGTPRDPARAPPRGARDRPGGGGRRAA